MDWKVGGVKYRVEEQGSGPPLLLLHGFTGGAVNWEPFVPAWSLRFRVIRVDLIGHGETDSPGDPARYSMESVVADLVGILDSLGVKKTDLLGYSMGGRLALSLATTHPERVQRLMLESSSPGLKTREEREERIRRDEALADRIETDGIRAFVDAWEQIPLFASQRFLPEEVRRKLREQRLANHPRGLANSLRGMGTGAQPSWWASLDRLTLPVLLIKGEWDAKFCRIAEEMKDKLADARMETVKGAGHAVHVEQPRRFERIVLDFLTSKI
ncbi:2-succinyl-6-hydroxy-2,4-cyclohexadiene-1-carboxylate synthase [Salinithrix halophila]|uniref:Putative 2-succinyl-6-hydroxy-2,4-cyclohexadiene-1-carboxylate synthase n=1 Tax=Salinithrix halophila TaxID=1485204 RepID=A0ABV8JF62_9BACL